MVAYQPIYSLASQGSSILNGIESFVVTAISENTIYRQYSPPVLDCIQIPDGYFGFLLSEDRDWNKLVGNLFVPNARNLFYFGHCTNCAGGTIGDFRNPQQSIDAN